LKISVAILNYNGKSWLDKFLQIAIDKSPEAEVIIIDNASTDDSVSFLASNFPKIRLIQNKTNSGFAGGYNEGLKRIDSDYYILLNSDIELTDNWIMPVINSIESEENIVAGQPKILAYHEKNKFEHAGAAGGFIDQLGYPFCRGRIFTETEIDQDQYNATTKVFWATGACLFIKADKYWEIGGLDDAYFAHMEEIDMCWRLQNKGYEIICEPAAKVYHVGGGTLDYRNPRKTYLNFRNSLYTVHKNKKGPIFFIIFQRLILDGVAGAKFLFSGDFKHIVSILKAHLHYYGHLKTLNAQRKQIVKKDFTSLHGVFKGSIVYHHFIKKVKAFSKLNMN
jgi:GT2 family glycosyltransferase